MSADWTRGVLLTTAFLAVVGCGRSEAPGEPRVTGRADGEAREVVPTPHTPGAGIEDLASNRVESPPSLPPIRVQPDSAIIAPGDQGLQLIAEREVADGAVIDLTHEVRWTAEPKGLVAIEPGGYLRPLGVGQVQVRGVLGDETAETRVQIREAGESGRAWDFAADVVPIFTRYGCNAGGCHGKADGQNGFHLSFLGYDPERDHRTLTREAAGRRLSMLSPESSLLLRKAAGRAPHGGGIVLKPGSDAYLTLVDWIAAGAPRRRGETHGDLAEVRVEPASARLDGPGPRQLRVVARFADGHERDVTRLASIRSNDEMAAAVDGHGLVRLDRRAEVDVVVRYQSKVGTARIASPINPELAFDFVAVPRRNFIDEELFRRLESLKVPPSPPSSDEAFLRRVTLDLTGGLPLPDEIRAYVADGDPEKRAKKVDELIGRPEFVLFWRLKLGDMLQISQARFGNGAGPYENWLTRRLQEDAGWDSMVGELLTSLGNPSDFRDGGPVNYALDGGGDPKVQAELTAQRFLGLRLRCAQCHDHPFDVWTQDDYYGLAAIFARIGSTAGGPDAMATRPEVRLRPEGMVEHLRTGQPADPRLLDGQSVDVGTDEDPRRALLAWMTRPDNPYFARAMSNWVWAQLFGKGIADPPDNLSAANPPVHPELLDALARDFIEGGYGIRGLIRTIATSEAYALSSTPVPGNASDTRLFSHHMPRPLTAHQLADSIAQATNVPDRFPNRSPRARTKAIEIFDPGTPSTVLDAFGRCKRTNGCSPVATPQLSLSQALLLIGGDAIEGKVSHLNGYLSNLLTFDPKPSAGEVVEFLYYRTLCRPPSAEERAHWVAELEGSGSLVEAAEDLFWALLNSREFAFNH